MPPAAILDIDGTLVDTNYHHAIAWRRAFSQFDVIVPMWRIHAHVGIGSDRFVEFVAGDGVGAEHGDELRAAHSSHYSVLIHEVKPFPAAHDLLVGLKERGHAVVLASSASAGELDHYLERLGARDLVDGWTSSADVDASKPAPDLIEAALDRAGTREAVLIGDSTWDCRAAAEANVPTIALLTGGFSEDALRAAGAAAVFESLEELQSRLGETPLATG